MRKAIIDSATDAILNVAVVAEPQSWNPAIAEIITRPARPEYRWVDKKTGQVTIKPALPEEKRFVLRLTNHGFSPMAGPMLFSADVKMPGGLLADTRYWVRPIDGNDFLLTADPAVHPGEITDVGEGPFTLSEEPYNPGPGIELVDDDGTARPGGTYDRGAGKFNPPPPPPPPTAKEILEGRAGNLDVGRLFISLIRDGTVPKDSIPAGQLDALNALAEIDGEQPL